MEYAVPGLPAGVGVEGLLVEVGVDLAGHLDPLQQLPPELVVLGEDLAVVSESLTVIILTPRSAASLVTLTVLTNSLISR